MWAVGGFRGYGGSVWVMGEWAVSQWIVDITSFQKIYGLYGPNILKKVLQWKSWSDDGQTHRQTDRHTESISTYRLGPSVGWAE